MRVDSFAWFERCVLQILRLSASLQLTLSVTRQLPEKKFLLRQKAGH